MQLGWYAQSPMEAKRRNEVTCGGIGEDFKEGEVYHLPGEPRRTGQGRGVAGI